MANDDLIAGIESRGFVLADDLLATGGTARQRAADITPLALVDCEGD